MADRIRRVDLNKVLRDYKTGRFFNRTEKLAMGFQQLRKTYIRNLSIDTLNVGEVVPITGIESYSPSFNELMQEYLSVGYILMYNPQYDNPQTLIGFCLEPIPVSAVGECFVPNLTPAIFDRIEGEHTLATRVPTGEFVAGNTGEYYVIGFSNEDEDKKRFGYVSLLGTGTGGGGHLVGQVWGSPISFNVPGTVRVLQSGEEPQVFENIRCPLLRDNDISLIAGTKVIISQNQATKKWEIIEAQCPVGGYT